MLLSTTLSYGDRNKSKFVVTGIGVQRAHQQGNLDETTMDIVVWNNFFGLLILCNHSGFLWEFVYWGSTCNVSGWSKISR